MLSFVNSFCKPSGPLEMRRIKNEGQLSVKRVKANALMERKKVSPEVHFCVHW